MGTSYSVQYVSNRRSVSEDEKNYALQLAQAEISVLNNEGLLIIMKPSHVYSRFYVVNSFLSHSHRLKHSWHLLELPVLSLLYFSFNQAKILETLIMYFGCLIFTLFFFSFFKCLLHQNLPTEWVMKYISLENQDVFLRFGGREWRTRFNYNRPRKSAGLTSGWNHFAVDNNLEEFDVCVFEPGSPVNDSFCLDVKIFRVVEEITPLTALPSPSSGKGKRKSIKRLQEEQPIF